MNQDLLPVCFKRKLAYTGAYIEEYIERGKVEMYLNWFREHNHLYKDITFDNNKLESFMEEALSSIRDNLTEGNEFPKGLEEENIEILETFDNQRIDEPDIKVPDKLISTQTTLFMNKYEEDPKDSYVAD